MTIDDWKYKRTRQQHFTESEIALIRTAYKRGRKPKAVARELECSTRVIQTHYANLLMGIGTPVRARPKANKASRFYRSNFDLKH